MLDSSVENEDVMQLIVLIVGRGYRSEYKSVYHDHIMKLKLLRVTNYCIALSAWLLESVVPRDLG